MMSTTTLMAKHDGRRGEGDHLCGRGTNTIVGGTQQSIRRIIEADADNDDDVDSDKDNSIGNGSNTKPNVAMGGDHKCN